MKDTCLKTDDYKIEANVIPFGEVRSLLDMGSDVEEAILLRATTGDNELGRSVIRFSEYYPDGRLLIAGGEIYTSCRGFARRLLEGTFELLEKYSLDNYLKVQHREFFSTEGSRRKLEHIYLENFYSEEVDGYYARTYP